MVVSRSVIFFKPFPGDKEIGDVHQLPGFYIGIVQFFPVKMTFFHLIRHRIEMNRNRIE